MGDLLAQLETTVERGLQCIWCISITQFSRASSATPFGSQPVQLEGTKQMLEIWEPLYKVLSFRNICSKTFVAASGNGKLNCALTSV